MQQVTCIQKRDAAAVAGDAIGELPACLPTTSLQATTALLSNKVPNMLTEHHDDETILEIEKLLRFCMQNMITVSLISTTYIQQQQIAKHKVGT
jgi:hypothetical protein